MFMCKWRDKVHVVFELGEEFKGCLEIPWLMREELPRYVEGSTIHKI